MIKKNAVTRSARALGWLLGCEINTNDPLDSRFEELRNVVHPLWKPVVFSAPVLLYPLLLFQSDLGIIPITVGESLAHTSFPLYYLVVLVTFPLRVLLEIAGITVADAWLVTIDSLGWKAVLTIGDWAVLWQLKRVSGDAWGDFYVMLGNFCSLFDGANTTSNSSGAKNA